MVKYTLTVVLESQFDLHYCRKTATIVNVEKIKKHFLAQIRAFSAQKCTKKFMFRNFYFPIFQKSPIFG